MGNEVRLAMALSALLLLAATAAAEDACTTEYAPVCAANGTTYFNQCKASQADANVLYKGECEFEENSGTDLNLPIPSLGLPNIPGIGGVLATLQGFAGKVGQTVSPAEWGTIFGLGALAFFLFRANFWAQMLLKFAGFAVIGLIVLILTGMVNL